MQGSSAFLCDHVIKNSQDRGETGYDTIRIQKGNNSGEVTGGGERDVIRLQIYSVKRGLQS